MTGAGTVIGALFGGFLASQLQPGSFMLLSSLQTIFLISMILRLLSMAFLPKISEVETKECMPVRYVFWETVAVGPAKGIEHAVTSAFRYPYGVKIKNKLGLNNSRKIKISKKNFDSQNPEKTKKADQKKERESSGIFDHIGVSPIKIPPGALKPREVKKGGVLEMALGDIRKPKSEEGNKYVELGLERQVPKSAKIVVHSLQRFSETDKIVKSIRAKNVVFVGLKTMKQTNLDELKQAVTKINRACIENNSSLSLVDEEWLIITPQTAAIV
jgi:SepF-like predicted cell division protein (DUF552 family)